MKKYILLIIASCLAFTSLIAAANTTKIYIDNYSTVPVKYTFQTKQGWTSYLLITKHSDTHSIGLYEIPKSEQWKFVIDNTNCSANNPGTLTIPDTSTFDLIDIQGNKWIGITIVATDLDGSGPNVDLECHFNKHLG